MRYVHCGCCASLFKPARATTSARTIASPIRRIGPSVGMAGGSLAEAETRTSKAISRKPWTLGRRHGEAAGRITTRPTRSPHLQRGRSLRPGSHNYTGRTRKTGNRAEREFPGKLGIGSRIRSDLGNSPTWLDLRFDDVCLGGEEASRRGRLRYDHESRGRV